MNKIGSETLHGSVSSFIRSKIYDKELAAGDTIPSEHRPHFRRRGPSDHRGRHRPGAKSVLKSS